MPSIRKDVVRVTELAPHIMELREKGYLKGSWRILEENKHLMEVRAWRKRPRPVGRPRKAIIKYVQVPPKGETGDITPIVIPEIEHK